jgi:mono/diheme cytochrome c family protein
MRDSKQTTWVSVLGLGCLIGAVGVSAAPPAKRAAPPAPVSGEKIFKAQCASCHGASGEGGPGYTRPLGGTRTLDQLMKYLSTSMPPGAKHVAGADARAVSSFVYQSFTSPLAQAKRKPARVALSRLTVRQFRTTVADLLGSFRGAPPLPAERGLRAEYFKTRWFEDKGKITQRVDPGVWFDFKDGAPTPGDYDPHTFCIRWRGGLMVPETGDYEFIVRSEHAFQLFVNDPRKPVIDAMVRSGKDNEFKVLVPLIGGRAYPLRLEFFKSTQGVDDSEKQKKLPPAPASIRLAWKRPHLSEEPIPARALVPIELPEQGLVTTPFPPDDRSTGYERASSISREWDDATTAAALQTADYVVANLRGLSQIADDDKERTQKLKTFCRTFVERAFRRPLTPELTRFYVDRQFLQAPDTETAVKRTVLLTLKSPRFLYREPGARRDDPYATASRLSFALWDSLPDETLLKAATTGQLATREQVRAQAERMLQDPRAWYKLREFFLQWLKVEAYPDLAKDIKRFPDFTPEAAADLRTSLELTLEDAVWNDRSDFRELLLSDRVFLNGRLAKIYGVALPDDAPFQPVTLEKGQRAGVLTHPYVLASFAYIQNSSPIHRGVLVARNMLGRNLAPPPIAVAPLAPSLHPNMTTRERVALQTKPAACVSCHSMINPLGYPLERFDAIGRLRDKENGRPIDASGGYTDLSGQKVAFAGPQDLARYIAGSDEAHAAFVQKLFQYQIKQPIRAFGPKALPELQQKFTTGGYNVRRLMAEIATKATVDAP